MKRGFGRTLAYAMFIVGLGLPVPTGTADAVRVTLNRITTHLACEFSSRLHAPETQRARDER
jgi:hypothetical protein